MTALTKFPICEKYESRDYEIQGLLVVSQFCTFKGVKSHQAQQAKGKVVLDDAYTSEN